MNGISFTYKGIKGSKNDNALKLIECSSEV